MFSVLSLLWMWLSVVIITHFTVTVVHSDKAVFWSLLLFKLVLVKIIVVVCGF